PSGAAVAGRSLALNPWEYCQGGGSEGRSCLPMPAAPGSRGASAASVRLLVWAAIAWIVIFWRLGYPSLLDPDEAHYAELTREMVRARSWFVPLLDGAPYIDKPVLFHWLQGLFVEAFGESEVAMRLPTALAAVALIWI